MLIPTKEKGIELLNKALPLSDQIENIDLNKDNSIYFDWRNKRYKLDLEYCRIDISHGCLLEGNDCSILMTQCLKSQLGAIL